MTNPFALLIGWVLDLIFGDPQRLPHPVVGFGKMISWGEHRLNKGAHRKLKGALFAITLILLVFVATFLLRYLFSKLPSPFGEGMGVRLLFDIIIIYFCLAGTTLIREVRNVFLAVDRSLEEQIVPVSMEAFILRKLKVAPLKKCIWRLISALSSGKNTSWQTSAI